MSSRAARAARLVQVGSLVLAVGALLLVVMPFSRPAPTSDRRPVACGPAVSAAAQSNDAVRALRFLAKNPPPAAASKPPTAADFRHLQLFTDQANRYLACHRVASLRVTAGLGAALVALILLALVRQREEHPAASFRVSLAAIATFGLAARTLLMMTTTRYKDLGFDAAYYDLSAKALSHGHGFVDPFALYFGNRLKPSALFPPAYSVFLTLFAPLGMQSRQWHLFVGCCLGAVTIVLCACLARYFVSDRASLAVALLAAVYPPFLGADTSGMSETLYLPLVLATLLLAMRCTSRTAWPWALMGVTIGLAALTRGEALIFLPLLVVPVAICCQGNARRKAALVGLSTVIALVLLVPWAIRNASTFGRPVLLSNSSSTVIAGANCDSTYRGPYLGSWVHACLNADRSGALQTSEVRLNDTMRREGLSYLTKHRGRLPVVVLVRVLRTYGFYAPTQQFRLGLSEGQVYSAERIGWFVYMALLAFSVVGARDLLRRRTSLRPQIRVLVAPIMAVTVVSILAYGNPRFRLAAEPTLLVLAVLGMSVIARGARGARGAGSRPMRPGAAPALPGGSRSPSSTVVPVEVAHS